MKKNKQFAIIGVVVTLLNLLLLYEDIERLSYGWEYRCAITTFVLVTFTLFAWKQVGLKFYSPVFFIIFSLYMFHLSSVSVIGIDTQKYDEHQMLYRYGDELGFYGFFYSELFIEIFIVCYLFFYKNNVINNVKSVDVNDRYLCASRKIGVLLLSISFSPELYHDVSQVLVKATGGYSAMNSETDYSFYGIPLGYFTKLFMPSIIILLSSYRNEKKIFLRVAFFASLYFVVFMFLTGRKGNSIQSLIPIIFLYFYFFRPKFKFSYLIYIYVGLYFIAVVTATRQYAMTSDFKTNVIGSIERVSPIKDICLEMGGSIKAPIQAIMAIPSNGDFQYGLSYPASIIYSIGSGLHMPVESIKKYALFNVYLGQPERGSFINDSVAAMGGSIIAEWYWNFGWVGLPLVFILALFISKYERNLIMNVNKPITFALYVSLLYFLLRWTRGYFNDVIWQSLFIFVLTKIIILYKYKSLRRYL